MTLSAILEVAIGLALIYYALGLVVNLIVTAIKDIADMRAVALEAVLVHSMKMNRNALFNRFKERPLIRNLRPITNGVLQVVNRDTEDRKPQDIPAPTFSLAMLDALSSKDFVFNGIREVIKRFIAEHADESSQQILTGLLTVDDADLVSAIRAASNRIPDPAIKAELNKWVTILLGNPEEQLDIIRAGIQGLPPGDTKDALLNLIDISMTDVNEARARLEAWYDDMMKNVTLLFTKNVRQWVAIISLAVAFIVGADSIFIAQTLWEQPTRRAAIAAAVPGFVEEFSLPETSSNALVELSAQERLNLIEVRLGDVNKILDSLEELDIPVTWWQSPWPQENFDRLLKIIGLLITGAATSRGASFWYDILKKVNPSTSTKKSATQSSVGLVG